MNRSKLVLTNGCFDMLHPGHVRFLQTAALRGDRLWVLLNDDESIRKLKGEGRPVYPFQDRYDMLTALGCVHTVLEWDGRPEAIRGIRPDVYVKGDDYSMETLDPREREYIEQAGAEILFLPRYKDYSTTKLCQG